MDAFHKSVIAHLQGSGLGDAHLNELAKTAAEINVSGLKSARIVTKGIPIPDSIRVSGVADKASISKLLASIIAKTDRLSGIRVFPYGIPHPDLFHVDVDIGSGGPIGH